MKEKTKKIIILSVIVLLIIGLVLFLTLKDNDVYYSVIFENEKSIYLTTDVTKDNTVTKPSDPEKEGYVFKGWYYNDELYDFSSPISSDIVLEAKWEKISITYNVTFNVDEENTIEKVNENDTVTKPSDPIKEGYIFKGWYYNDKLYDFNTKVTSDIILTAKWEKVSITSNVNKTTNTNTIKKYTVTFEIDNLNKNKLLLEENKLITKPLDPEKEGYVFKGWYYNDKLYDFNTKVTSDITLIAKWEEEVITYDIEWIEIENSSIGQYYLYIKNSKGDYVDGEVEITTIDEKTSTKTVSKDGLILIKNVIKDAKVKNID